MATYWEKLRDPRWQRKRLEIMEAAGWECEECGAKDKTLNVHHQRYIKGRDPWDYERADLTCLCGECHETVTHTRSRIDFALARLGVSGQEVALGMLGAYLSLASVDGADYGVTVSSYEIALGVSIVVGCSPEEVIESVDAQQRADPKKLKRA